MKKILLTFAILWISAAWAGEELSSDSLGIPSHVELVTGTKQDAQFLGVKDDTVSLGGNIQGKFTVIRIPKNRFKSIVDNNGNDLLNQPQAAPTEESVQDSIVQDSTTQDTTVQDSTIQDSTQHDSTAVEHSIETPVEGQHIFVSFERRNSESTLAEQLENLIIRLLKESGTPITFVNRQEFNFCNDALCIKDFLKTHGAASAYVGRITSARTPDSVAVQMTHYLLDDSTKAIAHTAQINLSAIKALSDALSKDKLHRFVLLLQGEQVPVETKSDISYVRIETNPEGANIATKESEDICKSPCTFAINDTGKTEIYAYWNVDRQLWGARTLVKPIPGDTAKLSLKLKRVKPELLIRSKPEGAYIFGGSSPLTKNSKPIGLTPSKHPIYEPGLSTIQLRKEGFRDTMVTVFTSPTELTDVDIKLTPITNKQEQIAQQEWLHERKKNFVGKTLMGSSIAPILLGTLFIYLANLDYEDADKIKQDLDRPVAGGENYQARVSKNKDYVDKGDQKMIIGGSLLGAGFVLLGVGFVLTF